MLGTVLEKLQTLLSKSFLVVSFTPMLIFTCLNGAVLYLESRWFQDVVEQRLAAAGSAIDQVTSGATALIAIAVVAFLFSMLNTQLREVLEGKVGWPSVVAGAAGKRQWVRLERLEADYRELQRIRRTLKRDKASWTEKLSNARDEPQKQEHCRYDDRTEAARHVAALRRARGAGRRVTEVELRDAVGLLAEELRTSPLPPPPEDAANGRLLDRDHSDLVRVIDYAEAKVVHEINRLFSERQFNFPGAVLAPTAMGNIAMSIQSYARSRYELNIDMFWTRLQKVMQGEAFYAVLQDAKMQLDFLVSIFWLSSLSVLCWLPVLAGWSYNLPLYLAVGLLGPATAIVSYRIGLQSYRAFADLVRSSIDLYRLDLLKALRIPVPSGASQECEIWRALNQRMAYGESFNISYEPPKSV